MEELISWGVQQFISIAPAGALHTKASLGDLVVCEKAVRDESTSCRYLPATKYIHAPRRMTSKLQQELKKADLPYHIGSSWTTDRLTSTPQSDLLHYQQEGVLAIDREAAALFAVAHFYQVDLGILLTITGSPDDLLWQPHPYTEHINRSFQSLLRIAIQAALP
jgi:purine-nucleoside phosphorylase